MVLLRWFADHSSPQYITTNMTTMPYNAAIMIGNHHNIAAVISLFKHRCLNNIPLCSEVLKNSAKVRTPKREIMFGGTSIRVGDKVGE